MSRLAQLPDEDVEALVELLASLLLDELVSDEMIYENPESVVQANEGQNE